MSQALPYHATGTRPVTRQGKVQTDSKDQDGEQQTTPPTPQVRCSSHPDPPAYREPVQASRPKGHLKVSQSTGRDLPPRPDPTTQSGKPNHSARGSSRSTREDQRQQASDQPTLPPTVRCPSCPDLQACQSSSTPNLPSNGPLTRPYPTTQRGLTVSTRL